MTADLKPFAWKTIQWHVIGKKFDSYCFQSGSRKNCEAGKGVDCIATGYSEKTRPKQMLELFREFIKGIIYMIIAFPFLVIFITILLLAILRS